LICPSFVNGSTTPEGFDSWTRSWTVFLASIGPTGGRGLGSEAVIDIIMRDSGEVILRGWTAWPCHLLGASRAFTTSWSMRRIQIWSRTATKRVPRLLWLAPLHLQPAFQNRACSRALLLSRCLKCQLIIPILHDIMLPLLPLHHHSLCLIVCHL